MNVATIVSPEIEVTCPFVYSDFKKWNQDDDEQRIHDLHLIRFYPKTLLKKLTEDKGIPDNTE